MRYLFVCLGNICRSPLAVGLMRRRLAAQGRDAVVDSAGTGDWHVGNPPDARAIAAAARRGIDISDQRARQVQAADFDRFDLILAMDRFNLAALERLRPPAARAELRLLRDGLGVGDMLDVPDPYYSGDFDRTAALIDEALERLLAAPAR